jgi:uncharacterized OsmC-like protein
MAERVTLIQKNNFETEYLAPNIHDLEDSELRKATRLQDMTPYGQLLAGLAGCTAIVLHTFAFNHGLELAEVELRLEYDRIFQEDCENCENINRYEERIQEEIILRGDLSEKERERLFRVSKHCPIHKMMESGIHIDSTLGRV